MNVNITLHLNLTAAGVHTNLSMFFCFYLVAHAIMEWREKLGGRGLNLSDVTFLCKKNSSSVMFSFTVVGC